jgi:cytochrome oxidase Cu insertion factor (SCO1/SenC/PrrC family)
LYLAAPQIPGDPQSSHSAAIWLIDRHGRLAALIDAGVPVTAENLAHDFRVLIEKA